MKHINLTPTGASSRSSAVPAGSTMIFGVVGVVVVVALAGYFAMARVSTIKDETTSLTQQQATSDSQNTQVVAQLAELGQKPTTLSWDSVAVAYMKQVTDKAAARTDFPRFLSDMTTVLPNGAWFDSVGAGANDPNGGGATPATDATASSGMSVKFVGYALSIRDVNTIIANLNALKSMEGADLSNITVERSQKGKVYRHFTITANLLGGGTMSADGTLVGNGGVDGLALEPRPVIKTAAVKKATPDPLGGLVRDTGRAGGAS